MTHAEVKAMVEEMGLPYAYDHFAEGRAPTHRSSVSCTRERKTSAQTTLCTTISIGWLSRCTPITKIRILRQQSKKS